MGTFKLNKGYDLKIVGEPSKELLSAARPLEVAIDGREFQGLRPKILVQVGDRVQAGTALFHHKAHADFCFTSPVSGTVKKIRRGERRVLQEVIISPDEKDSFLDFGAMNAQEILNAKHDVILNRIGRAGLMAEFTQRPFGTVIDPNEHPRDIFISAYHTAPLAADINILIKGNEAFFQAGINALSRLAHVHLGIPGERRDLSDAVSKAQHCTTHSFGGPHPVGNVGVQIHHVSPIRKGQVVWTVPFPTVIAIGHLFLTGKIQNERIIALGGEGVSKPCHIKTVQGAALSTLLEGRLKPGAMRIIDGDVLSGRKVEATSYLGLRNSQLSVIPEIEDMAFMGWAMPGFGRESISRTFFSWLGGADKRYSHNTGYHGGVRAFVQTGAYENVLPMDLYPVHLLKAILAGDIEAYEGLGILEVIPEDFALCDYVCVSKIEAQTILRQGLDAFKKAGGG